jgi:plastocyanin
MSRDDSGTDDDPVLERLRRRGVLRSVGAGAALSIGGYGLATQEGDDGETPTPTEGAEEDQELDRGCGPCIDTLTGYHVLLGEARSLEQQLPPEFIPDRSVELRIQDADVVFQDGPQGETPTPTDGNATETGDGTPTPTPVGNVTETTAGNQTGTPGANATTTPGSNDTTPGGNATATPGGNQTETPDGNQTTTAGGAETGDVGQSEEAGFPDFFFDPVGLRVHPRDIVAFQGRDRGHHTVAAYHPRFSDLQRRVPEGVPGFSSSAILPGEFWLYQFQTEGVYDLFSIPYEEFGMVMRIVVLGRDSEEVPSAPGATDSDGEGPSDIASQVLSAPELDPQNVVDQTIVRWADLTGIDAEPPSDLPDGPAGAGDGGPEVGADAGGTDGDAAGGNETTGGNQSNGG